LMHLWVKYDRINTQAIMPSNSKRYNIKGHAHELTFSCYKRQGFLNNDQTRQLFANALIYARRTHNYEIWAYVIMPEHVHVMIYPKNDEYSISDILKSIKQSVSRRVVKQLKDNNSPLLTRMRTGLSSTEYRFWQDGGGYDRNYVSPDEILKQINYIHNNPVRRRLVDNPCDWYWSSASEWLMGGEGPVSIDREFIPEM
ncbi:transposase, partial [bacterium]|nr:transposase [bacterium]MBU1025572.1 transposase [bacterium]